MLASAKVITRPFNVQEPGEVRVTLPTSESGPMVKQFWRTNSLVVSHLASGQIRDDFGTLQHALGVYTESRVLRAALYDGTYTIEHPLFD